MRAAIVLCATAACASAGGDLVDSGGGSGSGSDASVMPDSAMPIDAFVSQCPSTDTCAAATMLGSVSGDTGNQKLTATGYRAAWYRVRVTEDDSSIGGAKLRVAAKLTSPAAVDFDVFVYVNTGSDVVECNAPTGSTTTNGNTDQVKVEWGEGTISNGNDDDRSVSIEVRPKSGQCMASYTWQLEVEGHYP
ncbi:MAG: hypothetical protein HOV81_26445 [Kofleriaceae bacterium]|nr:hypothetical protein [Kofleriaceae bacterium]